MVEQRGGASFIAADPWWALGAAGHGRGDRAGGPRDSLLRFDQGVREGRPGVNGAHARSARRHQPPPRPAHRARPRRLRRGTRMRGRVAPHVRMVRTTQPRVPSGGARGRNGGVRICDRNSLRRGVREPDPPRARVHGRDPVRGEHRVRDGRLAPGDAINVPGQWHAVKGLIPGGTGQVGAILSRAFHRDGHQVVVLGRHPKPAPWRTLYWDATTLDGWANELDGADVVINLAGRNVNCRYGPENREAIMRSRVESTQLVGKAIAAAKRPPHTWLQASTATIYAHRFDAPNDESGIIGGAEPETPDTWRFSIDVAKAWEAALDDANVPGTRKVKLR